MGRGEIERLLRLVKPHQRTVRCRMCLMPPPPPGSFLSFVVLNLSLACLFFCFCTIYTRGLLPGIAMSPFAVQVTGQQVHHPVCLVGWEG